MIFQINYNHYKSINIYFLELSTRYDRSKSLVNRIYLIQYTTVVIQLLFKAIILTHYMKSVSCKIMFWVFHAGCELQWKIYCLEMVRKCFSIIICKACQVLIHHCYWNTINRDTIFIASFDNKCFKFVNSVCLQLWFHCTVHIVSLYVPSLFFHNKTNTST